MDNKKRRSSSILLIFILVLLGCFIIFAFMDTGSSGVKITGTEAYTMLENGEIAEWQAQVGGSVKIRIREGSSVTAEQFPTRADYYFDYSSTWVDGFVEKTKELNSGKDATDPTYIVGNVIPQGISIFEILMPILYIAFGIFIIYFIFKLFSNNNKSAMNFGRSRARATGNIKVRFSDIAGADEEKEELAEIVEFLKNPTKFTDLGARIPKGVLLVGPPGTGKTLLARAVAGESNVPFLSISGSDFVEMFVGVGASRVRDLFDQAKKCAPCIVFIDEIDAVGRQRGTGLGGGNDEREQTLNQLLVEMDGFEPNEGIIVLAATNRSDVLDPALLRPGRFDRQIYVHTPDVRGREGIIRIHAKNKPIDDEVDFKTLARITSGFTGADIENMLNEAAILAARANRPKILMQDLTEGINKVIMGPQKKSRLVTERDKKITAYHESGHAILAKKLENAEEVQEVSIIPRGMAAGYTMSRPDSDDSHMTYAKLNDTIAELMGGRLAEEIFMKDISTGASNDIQRASEIARKMVQEWGMSKKFGFISFNSENEVFIGRDYQTRTNYSEKTAGEIDDEVKDILDHNYSRAKKILLENKKYIIEMAELLLEKETIYKDEVDMILEGKSRDEIIKHMDEQEEKRKAKDRAGKKEKEVLKNLKEAEVKVRTGEVFLKNGIISPEEFNKIKAQHAEAVKAYEEHMISKKTEEETKPQASQEENVSQNEQAEASIGQAVDEIFETEVEPEQAEEQAQEEAELLPQESAEQTEEQELDEVAEAQDQTQSEEELQEAPLEESEEDNQKGEETVEVVKRGRGRPRKNAVLPTEETKESQVTTEKRGRGRPKKTENVVEKKAETAPKKRGRPRKDAALSEPKQEKEKKEEKEVSPETLALTRRILNKMRNEDRDNN